MVADSCINPHKRRLIAIFWLIGIILGALQAWDARHVMYADGISYLDIGDAYLRGDWKTAINANWSPLYSWLLGFAMFLLKPSPYYEFTIVHLVNFVIYLLTLGCFHFFLLQLIYYHRFRQSEALGNYGVTFPEWAWIALGYSLFIQSSLNLITIGLVSPDMCVAAFVYLACGILLRIRRGITNYFTFALLGVVLGFGYLAKTVMFPLAFIFLSLSLFSLGNFRKALPRTMLALFLFLSIASPFIIAISHAKGRITFGDAGKYNYWQHVNGYFAIRHWTGAPPGSGTPKHPPRKIFDMPTIYEFGTPIGGTYPIWYDPSYWHEGIKIHFDLKEQLRAIKINLKIYYHIFYPRYSVLIFSSFILYLMGRRRWSTVKDLAEYWILFIPAVTAMGMYCLISAGSRYVGPFVVLLWLGIFSGIRLPDSEESKRLLRCATIVMVLVLMMVTGRHLLKNDYPSSHVHWEVADALKQMGVLPGDKVASIGQSYSHFWARLAKVRIVAEITTKDIDTFWEADDGVKSKIYEAFSKTGAKAIVTDKVPEGPLPPGWQKIANTDYYIYILSK
jgi:4-amino-4-deoxy-L-arabinose transferase-like glycosyltransferase